MFFERVFVLSTKYLKTETNTEFQSISTNFFGVTTLTKKLLINVNMKSTLSHYCVTL